MDKYEAIKEKRDKITNIILNSDSKKKLIVAGPGTGKSYLFKLICENNIKKDIKKNLVLSFINELVDDLRTELFNIAEVKTLHSFALSNIKKNNKLFLELGEIIKRDYKLIHKKDINFNEIFCELKIDNTEELQFYSERRKYYNFFSPNCSIYTLIIMFEKDPSLIPNYDQILIDEFQDFNKLETKFIDLLSTKNSILIVGDDDQSLYSFKFAQPNEIRNRSKEEEYTKFKLPYCSRCPEVIINAFNSLVSKAKEKGYLKDRLEKDYIYFPSEKKDIISKENPKIIVRKEMFHTKVTYEIDKEIQDLIKPSKKTSVLIICTLKNQIVQIAESLRDKGYININTPQNNKRNILIDGFNLLLENKECNLGWRIVSETILEKEGKYKEFEELITKSNENKNIKFKDLLEINQTKYIKKIIAILNKLRNKKEIKQEEYDLIVNCFNYDPNQITLEKLINDIDSNIKKKNIYNKTSIKITNILGSKGLTSDYVFLVNYNDKFVLGKENKITDEEICKFMVTLTRAKRRLYIFTSEKTLPTFVQWIDNKCYLES